MPAERTALVCDVQRFSIHDGPGIRTTIFFKGCPLSCRWCQNPETISFDNEPLHTAAECILCGFDPVPDEALTPLAPRMHADAQHGDLFAHRSPPSLGFQLQVM